MAPSRRPRPLSRSAAAVALTYACCGSGGRAPAADAWIAPVRRGGVVHRRATTAPPMPSADASRPCRCHRARCRPRRERGSVGEVGHPTAVGGEEFGAAGGGSPWRLSMGLRAGTEGAKGGWRPWRPSSRSLGSEAEVMAGLWRGRFWRRLIAGLVAATALLWLAPRVAAAASTAAASVAEEVGAAAAASAAEGLAAETAASTAAPAAAAAAASATPKAAERASSSLIRPLGTLQVLPTRAELELSLRLLFAAVGGGAVGLERSSSDRPAGVRTMALVSLGAAAFTLCSMYGFMSVSELVGPNTMAKYDPSRLASNVASGVGFIGAGVITNNRKAAGVYDRQSTVGGLTTAAAIWASAAIGVASGVGLYFIGASAVASTITILRFGRLKKNHIDIVGGGRDVTVGSKKKKKAEALVIVADGGGLVVDGAGRVQSALTMEGANATVALKPSVAFAGDDMAEPKHGGIDLRLEEMSEHEDAGDHIPSPSGDGMGKSRQHDAGGKKISPAAGQGVKLEEVWGSEFASGEGDKVVEVKRAQKKTKKDGRAFIDAPPMPPPSSADPLLEKYLWGVEQFRADEDDDEMSRSSGESSHHPRLSIEEEQEVVFRDRTGGKKTRGAEGKEAGP